VVDYAGTAVSEQISVANATAVEIPSSVPAVAYRLSFSVDKDSAGVWEVRTTNATTFGHQFFVGQILVFHMAANKSLFVFHDQGSAQDINVISEPVS
jgi:hypothetical protein